MATNRKARHQFHIVETYEAGLVLLGTEVKALREGKVSLIDGYARFHASELYLLDIHIGAYSHASVADHDPLRERKLLLSRRELGKLRKAVDVKGQTLVPLSVYFKGGWAKVDLAIAVGKQLRDKRRDLADRDAKRQLERVMKSRRGARDR